MITTPEPEGSRALNLSKIDTLIDDIVATTRDDEPITTDQLAHSLVDYFGEQGAAAAAAVAANGGDQTDPTRWWITLMGMALATAIQRLAHDGTGQACPDHVPAADDEK